MKALHFSRLLYGLILLLGTVGIYLILSYDRFFEVQSIAAIVSLLLLFIIFKYFNSTNTANRILKTVLIGAGLFYSVMIIGYRLVYFINIQNNRNEISSESSVNFEKESFLASLEKAKKEDKLIFLDIYTGWCGPCLRFSKTVLRDQEVIQILNSKFINLKYDGEVGEGIEISKKYGQGQYPVLLILDSAGNIKEDIFKTTLPDKNMMMNVLAKYK